MRFNSGAIDAGNPEECIPVAGKRPGLARRSAGQRGDAAIGDAIVIDIFIGKPGLPAPAQINREVGVDRKSLAVDMVAKAVQRLIFGVDAKRGCAADRQVQIARNIPTAKAGDTGGRAGNNIACRRRLLHAVDDPATAAAAENQRVGALEDFHPFDVVEPAVVLDVIANAIEEEVGSGILAAQSDLIAVALALADGGPRNIAQDVGQAALGLIVKLFAGDDLDALRNVDQRGVGLGCGPRIGGAITI